MGKMYDERIPPRCQKQVMLPIKDIYSNLPAFAILLSMCSGNASELKKRDGSEVVMLLARKHKTTGYQPNK